MLFFPTYLKDKNKHTWALQLSTRILQLNVLQIHNIQGTFLNENSSLKSTPHDLEPKFWLRLRHYSNLNLNQLKHELPFK